MVKRVGQSPLSKGFRGPSYMIAFEEYSEKARRYHGRATVYVTVWRSKFPPPTSPEALHTLLAELAASHQISLPAVARLSRNQAKGEMRGFHLISSFEVSEKGMSLIEGLPKSRGAIGPPGFDFPWKRGGEATNDWSLDPRACPYRPMGGGLPKTEPAKHRELAVARTHSVPESLAYSGSFRKL